MKLYENYEGFVFDLDGTVYLEDALITGAKETINLLAESGKEILFVSNKTTGSRKDYFEFLRSNGLKITEEKLVTATESTINFLKKNHFGEPFFAIGEQKFIGELISSGLTFSDNPKKIKVVIVTLDRTLTFEKLEIAKEAIEKGAKFYAANIDNTCPVKKGEILDAGSTIAALEKSTHKKLEENFGKPSKFMIDLIREKIKIPLNKCLLIGDRLETDIKMANDAGMDSALVQTGVQKFVNGINAKPDYVINSIKDLLS